MRSLPMKVCSLTLFLSVGCWLAVVVVVVVVVIVVVYVVAHVVVKRDRKVRSLPIEVCSPTLLASRTPN